jgi:hypothetical protein
MMPRAAIVLHLPTSIELHPRAAPLSTALRMALQREPPSASFGLG